MDEKEFCELSQRVSVLEKTWELSIQIARVEERLNAAAQAIPLAVEPLKVQALELSRRVIGLEAAKNESAGKGSGTSASWGQIATVAFILIALAGLLLSRGGH